MIKIECAVTVILLGEWSKAAKGLDTLSFFFMKKVVKSKLFVNFRKIRILCRYHARILSQLY